MTTIRGSLEKTLETAGMRAVKGRLVFSENVDGKESPIRNAFLQLWDLDLIENDFMASGETDMDGNFEIQYNPKDAGRWMDTPDLVLRLVDREYAYDKQGQPISNWHIVKSWKAGDNITEEMFDFGTVRAAFWEYQSPEVNNGAKNGVCFTPRVDVIDGKTPQAQRHGHTLDQLEVGARFVAPHTKQSIEAKFCKNHPINETIEKAYPEKGCTRDMGEVSRSDAFLCDLVLNGFNPQLLKKGEKEGSYYVDFLWNGLQQDGRHFSPNTTANFRLEGDGLALESIAIQKRIGGDVSAHAAYRAPKLYTPADQEWDRVKRLFRCNYFCMGEAQTHLSETHLNVEQYIVPMRRNLLKNPVARLLFPHFYGTTAVNLAANSLLIASDGLVQKGSALTADSVKQAVVQNFGTLNWKGWRPRKPLCKDHKFAYLADLYWDVLSNYVGAYFQTNALEIKRYWPEVKRMSDELIAHSLPFIQSDDSVYYDSGEINTVGKFHPRVNGSLVSVSPVTGSEQADAEGLDNFRQLCTYLLYHSTFKHSWVNDLQYMMGGEIEFSTLGISDDITNMRIDPSKVVPPDEAVDYPFITYILNFTEYGYIMRNEDNDMTPDLIRAIVNRSDDFAKLNYYIR
ncbi:MAG: hypothetical protein ACI8RA_003002, partial [Chlamydiales bacterium]